MNRLAVLTICSMLLLSVITEAKLPSNIQLCSRNEKNLADCIIRSVTALQPRLVSGNFGPDFKLPPLDPFSLDNIVVDKGKDFHLDLSNLIIKGGSNFKIEKLRTNLDDFKFDFIINFPKLDIVGKYDVIFNLFGLSLKGNGDAYATLVNPRAKISIRADKHPRNGKTYFSFNKFQIKIQLGPRRIILKNLFQGNPTLEEIGNAFINGNSDFILKDVIPGVENSLANIFTNIANSLVGQASFEEAFPDI